MYAGHRALHSRFAPQVHYTEAASFSHAWPLEFVNPREIHALEPFEAVCYCLMNCTLWIDGPMTLGFIDRELQADSAYCVQVNIQINM